MATLLSVAFRFERLCGCDFGEEESKSRHKQAKKHRDRGPGPE